MDHSLFSSIFRQASFHLDRSNVRTCPSLAILIPIIRSLLHLSATLSIISVVPLILYVCTLAAGCLLSPRLGPFSPINHLRPPTFLTLATTPRRPHSQPHSSTVFSLVTAAPLSSYSSRLRAIDTKPFFKQAFDPLLSVDRGKRRTIAERDHRQRPVSAHHLCASKRPHSFDRAKPNSSHLCLLLSQ